MLPAPVSDLPHKLVVRGVAADEVVSAPLDGLGVSLGHSSGLIPSLQSKIKIFNIYLEIFEVTMKLIPPQAKTVTVAAMGNPNLTRSPAS